MAFLLDYEWPGNLLVLENFLEHAMVCCRGTVIEPETLLRFLMTGHPASAPQTLRRTFVRATNVALQLS
jgi:transcriptional regulator with PAS, ATPase and Fis domain